MQLSNMESLEMIPTTPPEPAMESDQEGGGEVASIKSDHEEEKAFVKSEAISSVGLSPNDIVQEIKALRNDIVDIKIMCKNIIHGL